MGYSCTVLADRTYQAAVNRLQAMYDGRETSNSWWIDGRLHFAEIGREQRDGRITGLVWRETAPGNDKIVRFGGLLIAADGRIKRFPSLPRREWYEVEIAGRREYTRYTGLKVDGYGSNGRPMFEVI